MLDWAAGVKLLGLTCYYDFWAIYMAQQPFLAHNPVRYMNVSKRTGVHCALCTNSAILTSQPEVNAE